MAPNLHWCVGWLLNSLDKGFESSHSHMKQIKEIQGNIIQVEQGSTIDPFHAYISLMLSMLKEPFMSSDLKFLIIRIC